MKSKRVPLEHLGSRLFPDVCTLRWLARSGGGAMCINLMPPPPVWGSLRMTRRCWSFNPDSWNFYHTFTKIKFTVTRSKFVVVYRETLHLLTHFRRIVSADINRFTSLEFTSFARAMIYPARKKRLKKIDRSIDFPFSSHVIEMGTLR